MTNPPAVAIDPLVRGTVSRLWRRLMAWVHPAPITTAAAFRTYLEERAALIAQKCAIDYCRGKTGLASYALFTEKPFLDALDVCRWETFVTVLADLLILAEGCLRPHVAFGERSRLCEALVGVYSGVLLPLPQPVHRARGWDDAIASFKLRLQAASVGDVKKAIDVADHSARQLFDTLPIHARMRELDQEVVYGAVRFRMVAVSQEMHRRVAAEKVVQQLLASGA